MFFRAIHPLAAWACLLAGQFALAADQPQWGERHSRNMISAERGLPESFDPATGQNRRWSVPLGSQCWSTPVVAGGRVLVGTNNEQPRDPRQQGDRGVLMCFRESDGALQWQLVVPKLSEDIYFDWPKVGMCSPPTVEGDRLYTVTNRDEVVCLDLHGMANGNDGPFRQEGRHASPADRPPLEVGPLDADIIWLLDLRAAAGVRPHDGAHASILLDGRFLYVNTSNGLNSTHTGVDKPAAPSLVVVDKNTGRLLAHDGQGIGPHIFHCTWSSPALGTVQGKRLIFFCGGDGVCYALDALNADSPSAADQPLPGLRQVWRFDTDPTAPKTDIHSYIRNRQMSPSTIQSMPVFHDNRVYLTHGGDIWWGKNQAWLKCLDATQRGDVTPSALRWSYPLEKHCCATPAVHESLVYAADCAGKLHCVDAATGRPYWVHDLGRETWASPLVADGKIYIGTRRGDFWVLRAGKELRVLSSLRLPDEVISTAVAANGTLYVSTMRRLYALRNGAQGPKAP